MGGGGGRYNEKSVSRIATLAVTNWPELGSSELALECRNGCAYLPCKDIFIRVFWLCPVQASSL